MICWLNAYAVYLWHFLFRGLWRKNADTRAFVFEIWHVYFLLKRQIRIEQSAESPAPAPPAAP